MGHSRFDLGRMVDERTSLMIKSLANWGQAQTLMGVLEQRKPKPSLQLKDLSA